MAAMKSALRKFAQDNVPIPQIGPAISTPSGIGIKGQKYPGSSIYPALDRSTPGGKDQAMALEMPKGTSPLHAGRAFSRAGTGTMPGQRLDTSKARGSLAQTVGTGQGAVSRQLGQLEHKQAPVRGGTGKAFDFVRRVGT